MLDYIFSKSEIKSQNYILLHIIIFIFKKTKACLPQHKTKIPEHEMKLLIRGWLRKCERMSPSRRTAINIKCRERKRQQQKKMYEISEMFSITIIYFIIFFL